MGSTYFSKCFLLIASAKFLLSHRYIACVHRDSHVENLICNAAVLGDAA
jgi:hypothetical protein